LHFRHEVVSTRLQFYTYSSQQALSSLNPAFPSPLPSGVTCQFSCDCPLCIAGRIPTTTLPPFRSSFLLSCSQLPDLRSSVALAPALKVPPPPPPICEVPPKSENDHSPQSSRSVLLPLSFLKVLRYLPRHGPLPPLPPPPILIFSSDQRHLLCDAAQ